jgi:hypothetical protein
MPTVGTATRDLVVGGQTENEERKAIVNIYIVINNIQFIRKIQIFTLIKTEIACFL